MMIDYNKILHAADSCGNRQNEPRKISVLGIIACYINIPSFAGSCDRTILLPLLINSSTDFTEVYIYTTYPLGDRSVGTNYVNWPYI